MVFCWDYEEGGNVEHIAEHGLTPDDVESAFDDITKHTTSKSSGRAAFFGRTLTGEDIFVVYDVETVDGDEYCCIYTAYPAKED